MKRGTFTLRPGGQTWVNGMRTTFNINRFDEVPPESVFAEIILLEVQEFISMMYGTFLRYYLPILKIDVLDEMSEDLIEIITSLTINGELSKWLLKLCRLSTREEEGILKKKYIEFGSIAPEQIGIDSYFTLNNSSRIVKMFRDF